MGIATANEAMPFQAPLAANRFRSILGTRHETVYVPLCIHALDDIGRHWPEYDAIVVTAAKFKAELRTHVHACRQEEGVPDAILCDHDMHIIECLANICREIHLRQPARQLPQSLIRVMEFFETHDEWSKGDGKEVTEYYYFIIPHAVSQSTGSTPS